VTDLALITAAQLPLLAAVHRDAFPDEPLRTADLALLLAMPGCFGLSAGAHGFVLVRVAADEAEILTIATHPASRRRGIARALLGRAARHAAELGATSLFLEVAEDNEPALALYATAGFTLRGHRPGYYARRNGPARTALVLGLALPGPSGCEVSAASS